MNDKTLKREIQDASYTSIIDLDYPSKDDYQTTLLYNDYAKGFSVLSSIEKELSHCQEFYFSVAFITKSGITCLKQIFKELQEKQIKGRILTTNYLYFNDPLALEELLKYDNLSIRIYQGDFHTKGYLFKKEDSLTFITGSSNLTQTALKNNKEWNIKLSSLKNGKIIVDVVNEFNTMWNSEFTTNLDQDWINQYRTLYGSKSIQEKLYTPENRIHRPIFPNKMQVEALKALHQIRQENQTKALIISATGTGKTYLSAFDVQNFKPKKFLFVVHREQILKQAMNSYQAVLGPNIKMGLLSGSKKQTDANYLFATIQSLSKDEYLKEFPSDYFDMICYDEVHKSAADSYLKVMNHFKPKFMLGMSATPERTDGKDVYQLFDYNIAYEIRLLAALEADLLCPFHYFGISDLFIDGELINDKTSFRKLTSQQRVSHILKQINYYGFCSNKVHGLVFCSRKEEAKRLSELFTEHGYPSAYLSGEDPQHVRQETIRRLEINEKNHESLDYIFTVDIFNEGIDIPCLNQIVMLRPTQSAIIFTQQLGRGLRKSENKDYVVILDFIGNYENNYLIPIALSGDKSYKKDNLRKIVTKGTNIIPGCSTIHFDPICKERILNNIDRTPMSDRKILLNAYQELKNKIGRIPNIDDFNSFGTIDVMRFVEYKYVSSYYDFRVKYDPEYQVRINPMAENMLSFVENKLMNGKRIHELMLIKMIIDDKSLNIDVYKNRLYESNNIKMCELEENNIRLVLQNKFVSSKQYIEKYQHAYFINDDFSPSEQFINQLNDPHFVDLLKRSVDEGIRRYESEYSTSYQDLRLVLNKKYTYEDVCRLLNWPQNIVAQNIGGYLYNKETNTFPIFINYQKEDGIKESINYHDHFISKNHLLWLSKSKRTLNSPEIKRLFDSSLQMKTLLFVRKNKDDKESKEFYFLGCMEAINSPHQTKLSNGMNVVEVEFKLQDYVQDELYDYIIGDY